MGNGRETHHVRLCRSHVEFRFQRYLRRETTLLLGLYFKRTPLAILRTINYRGGGKSRNSGYIRQRLQQ